MSEKNKELARRFYEEVFNRRNLHAIDQVCAANVVDHHPMPGQRSGAAGLEGVLTQFVEAFPDMNFKVEELVAERDFVVARCTMTATHRGPLFGSPPTGQRLTFHALDMVRVQNDKIVELWHYGDEAEILTQIGVKLPT